MHATAAGVMITRLVLVFFTVLPIARCAQPHIVFILADDIGWNDFSYHGSDQIQTPNIDALAYSGVILHQHYVQPICTPTRSALMTGRYPSNLGMQGWPIGAAELRALPQGKILPQYMKDLGYTTRMVGKWHLGFYRNDAIPSSRGFDSFLGYYCGLISYYDHIIQQYDGNVVLQGMDFRRNTTSAWDLSGQYATDVFTEEAERIIQEHNPSTPLFLYLAHLANHAGNQGKLMEAPQEEVNKFPHIAEPNRKTYAAMTSKLDESIGRVVKALEANGMLENSIIVFMTDNGAPTTNAGGFQNWGSNYPFRGIKGTQWEGGVRTPAIIWSPLLGSRRVSRQLMHISDWLPTLYTAAGGGQINAPLDGIDMWSTLVNDEPSKRDEVLLHFDEEKKVFGARKGTWKIALGSYFVGKGDDFYGDHAFFGEDITKYPYPAYNVSAVVNSLVGQAVSSLPSSSMPSEEEILDIRADTTVSCTKDPNATPCDPLGDTPCLFDLSVDPCETNNLASKEPDRLLQMLDLAERYNETLVPQLNELLDMIGADPKKFNNTWSPWVVVPVRETGWKHFHNPKWSHRHRGTHDRFPWGMHFHRYRYHTRS